ncbi:MAG: TonB family protein [Prevotella sp.]|nr:TonB family protein [Prevotella sp.]
MQKLRLVTSLLLSVVAATCVWADDRRLFNLKGPVKKATFVTTMSFLGYPEKERTVEFSPDGTLQEFLQNKERVTRRDDRVIATSDDGTSERTWMINDEGLVWSFQVETSAASFSFSPLYSYPPKRQMTAEIFNGKLSSDGSEYTSQVAYEVLDTDSHGNWTRRKARIKGSKEMTVVESCVITYYDMETVRSSVKFTVPVVTDSEDLEKEVVAPADNAVPADDRVWDTVEQMPQFPGGDAAMLSFVATKLRYPLIAAENGVQGRVVVSVVVRRDGTLEVTGTSGVSDPDLVREARRVVGSMPKFTPGKQNGQPVNVRYNIPVNFRLK